MLALDPANYPVYAAEYGDPSRTKVLGFGARPALLLVDVCEAYFDSKSPISLEGAKSKEVVAAVTILITSVRELPGIEERLPIIFAQTLYAHPELCDAGLLARKAPSHATLFHQQNPSNNTSYPTSLKEVSPLPSDLFHRKKYPSPFFGTNLAPQLTALGVNTLVIGGFATSGSVQATVLDAMQAGFRPMVVDAACGDSGGPEVHWANLMVVGTKYSDVVSLEGAEDMKRRQVSQMRMTRQKIKRMNHECMRMPFQ